MRVIQLAEVVPDAGFRRNNVRLIAAVNDYVVRSLLQPHVLAPEIPAGVHQLDCVERTSSIPGRARGMRRLPVKKVLHRDQSLRSEGLSVAGSELVSYMHSENDVHILEQACADQECFGRHQFFRDSGENFERAAEFMFLHQVFEHQRGRYIHGHSGVVTLAVPRSAVNHRFVVSHARLLRCARNAIDVGDEANHRLAGPIGRRPCRESRQLLVPL